MYQTGQFNKDGRSQEYQRYFLQANPNLELKEPIAENELFELLRSMNNNPNYDEDIFNELCDRVVQLYRSLTIDNFISVFIEAEDILELKVEHEDKMAATDQQEIKYIEDLIEKVDRQRYAERKSSPYNFLNIEEIRIEGIESSEGDTPEPYLLIKLGEVHHEAQPVGFSNSPLFNLNLQLHVHNYLDDLMITVLDRRTDPSTKEEIEYGEIDIPVDGLPFFEAKPISYSLYKNGKLINTKVTIVAHNEVNNIDVAVKDLSERRAMLQKKIEDSYEEKSGYLEQLTNLREPFLQRNQVSQSLPPPAEYSVIPPFANDTPPKNVFATEQPTNPTYYGEDYEPPRAFQQIMYQSNEGSPQQNPPEQFTVSRDNPTQFKPSINTLPITEQNLEQEGPQQFAAYPDDKTNRSVISEQGFGQIQASAFEEFVKTEPPSATINHSRAPAAATVALPAQPLYEPVFIEPDDVPAFRPGEQPERQNNEDSFDFEQPSLNAEKEPSMLASFQPTTFNATKEEQPPPENQKLPPEEFEQPQVAKSPLEYNRYNQASPLKVPANKQSLNSEAQQFSAQKGALGSEADEVDETWGALNEYISRTDKVIVIWLAIAIMISFYRSMIRDITIIAIFLTFEYLRRFNSENSKSKFLLAIATSQILDIFWFITYTEAYLKSSTSIDEGEESIARMLAVILSFVSFAYKVAVLISFYLLYQQPKEVEVLQEKFHAWIDGREVDEDEEQQHRLDSHSREQNTF